MVYRLDAFPSTPSTGIAEPKAEPIVKAEPAPQEQLATTSTRTRPIEPEDLERLRNPKNLLGEQFVLLPTDDREDSTGLNYKVDGFFMRQDGNQYEIVLQKESGEYPFLVDETELMGMLKDSVYVPA